MERGLKALIYLMVMASLSLSFFPECRQKLWLNLLKKIIIECDEE